MMPVDVFFELNTHLNPLCWDWDTEPDRKDLTSRLRRIINFTEPITEDDEDRWQTKEEQDGTATGV